MDRSEDERKNDSAFIASRDGILFIIDSTPEMFEVDPATQESYFSQCLKVYGSILGKKLSWNRSDWMGLILFGTTKWDTDPIETKNILTLQEFGEITCSMLSAIMYIYNKKVDRYNTLASSTEYPLNDVLWHAARSFDCVKVAMQLRQVVLLTCRDNPFHENRAEQHRIRLRAKAFGDININLRIVGLGEKWNHRLFYKDIEMLANKTDSEDDKPMKIEDLELQIKFPSKVTGHLKWKIGNGVVLRTVVSSFSRKTLFLKKAVMSKTTNEILEKHTHWRKSSDLDYDSDNEFEPSESQVPVKTDEPGNIRKAVTFGGKMITFLPDEVRNIRIARESGIELLGFKAICQDLAYYIKAIKFVGVDPSATTAEKELFAALLRKCEAKKVMATCVVSHKTGPYIANLIPCSRYNGFYVNKIAYTEQINDLDEFTYPYVYVGGKNGDQPLPTDNEGVALMKKIVRKLRIKWNPYMFQNPKLNAQLKYIETLALDDQAVQVDDTTLPPRDVIVRQLGDLSAQFDIMFPKTDCSGRGNNQNYDRFDESMIRELYESGTLEQNSHENYKIFARSLGLRLAGSKKQLLARINEYFKAK